MPVKGAGQFFTAPIVFFRPSYQDFAEIQRPDIRRGCISASAMWTVGTTVAFKKFPRTLHMNIEQGLGKFLRTSPAFTPTTG